MIIKTKIGKISIGDEIRVKKGLLPSPIPEHKKQFKTAGVKAFHVDSDNVVTVETDRDLRGTRFWKFDDICKVRDPAKYGVCGRS